MARLLRALFVCSLLLSFSVFAQSADQQMLSAIDAPDPVTPGNNITYTIQIRNNGPDPAVNGGLNGNIGGGLTFVSASSSTPGFACGNLGNNLSCTNPSFASGVTATFTVIAQAGAHLANFPDTTVSSYFYTSGTTIDPNNGNNDATVVTNVDAPQIDLLVTASDSPDPVFPDGNVTYTVDVMNAGPDAATTVNFNVVPYTSLRFVSSNVPAGWNCTLPAVGAINATFTCSRPSYAASASDTFTVVFSANDEQLGINDFSFNSNFGINGTGDDTNDPNNTVTVTTQYVTPDADIAVSVTDSPDPVGQNANITYTVDVVNNGPDTAPNATMSVYNSSGLAFVSLATPAGWSCTPPAIGAFVQFSCSRASFPIGTTSTFTVVANTDPTYYGINDGTIFTAFSTGSSIADPVNGNNVETEATAYVTADADLTIGASDSPDPVAPDGDITYTVTLGNTGPDSAAATLQIPMNGTLKFTSITTPAGFVCAGVPAAGSSASFSCTDSTFASGDSAIFTIVLNADYDAFGNFDQTIVQHFSVTSNVSDPDGTDNSVNVSTQYDVSNANLGITATDAPDPVAAGSNITYSGTITNAGPQSATNVTVTIPLHTGLLFVSMSDPAGFSCTPPAAGANGTITCTIATLANGANIPFSFVAQVNPTLNNGPDGFIQQGFLIGSNTNDPTLTNNDLTVTTQYTTPDADLVATNSDTPDPTTSGGTITYTQTIRNDGPDTAVNATFVQTLPSSVGFVSLLQAGPAFTCTTPAVGNNGPISCSIASLASGASTTFTLVVNVIATSGTVPNTVTADSDTYDPDPTDNVAGTTTTILAPVIADLGITKTTTADGAAAGSSIAYTITLTNNGPDAAANVVVTDTLPAELLFQSISVPSGFNCTTPAVGATGTITCTAASMASGTTVTFTLVVQLTASAVGPINNNATATSDTTDNNAGNSSGSAAAVPVSAGNTTDLSIQKSSLTTTAAPGDTVTYTIAVTNNGPGLANDVIVSDTLPASLLFQSITPAATFTCTTPETGQSGTITCLGGPLANGATANFTLMTTIAPSASGSIVNSAAASTSDSDTVPSNSAGGSAPIVVGTADLSINKTTAATEAPTGSTITYTITVTNNGPDTATNVIVSDNLPAGLQFVSATPSQGSCAGTDPFTCTLGSINNGASATISLQVLVTATSGTVTNTATVTADTDDGTPGNNSDTSPATPVTAAPASGANIPTMSEWALLALAAMLGLAAVARMRM
ncbi:MAG: DUF11 domain-containing protein [Acidobacteriota bacterium]|nr:DUF11 domain-containing protein [Acidobacteriota bacterium]